MAKRQKQYFGVLGENDALQYTATSFIAAKAQAAMHARKEGEVARIVKVLAEVHPGKPSVHMLEERFPDFLATGKK